MDHVLEPNIRKPEPLYQFIARQSEDEVKRDLDLICDVCGAHLCDIEPDDRLAVLVSVAMDHLPDCPGPEPE